MQRMFSALALATFLAAGACSRNNSKPADTTLNSDLSLAAQQSNQSDSVSATELTADSARRAGASFAEPAAHHTASGEVAHVHHVSHGGSAESSSGTSTTTSTSTTGGTVVKHTTRDAAIGAAAGAVLGATTSRSKVKGGLIGGVLGGVLGGVIGNNVDKKKKP